MSSEYSTENSDNIETSSLSSDDVQDHQDNLMLQGDIIKNYNVICEIGRGTYSIIWLAYNIVTNKFHALKVQNPEEYKDAVLEIEVVKKLPSNPKLFNNIIEHFTEVINQKKYLCSAWELHCTDLDSVVRNGILSEGLSIIQVKSVMKQLLEAIFIMHKKLKLFHGDIKPDNILIKGISKRNEFIIKEYIKEDFFGRYNLAKKDFLIKKGQSLKQLDTMNKEDKKIIRRGIHNQITNNVLNKLEVVNISKYDIDECYLKDIKISLADFGMCCEEHNFFEEPFGTRYYQAPEIILMGKCSYPVDIWAIGCTFYELLAQNFLFNPIKDSQHTRDYYHLCLINDTCGKFDKDFLKRTKYYKTYFDNGRLKDYISNDNDRLNRKIMDLNFDNDIKKIVKTILTKTLLIEPSNRIKITDLIKEPFFN